MAASTLNLLVWVALCLPYQCMYVAVDAAFVNGLTTLRIRKQTPRLHLSQNDKEEQLENTGVDAPPRGLRLNKVFKATHSRRAADKLISSGRVTINDEPVSVKGGCLVTPFVDVVKVDGEIVSGWEALNGISKHSSSRNEREETKGVLTETFEYVKYWKPRGVICTTDQRIPYNVIDEIHRDGYSPRHRVYPVGRLDKDTSGLILLTSDGRLPNASLRSQQKQPKVYEVFVDRPFQKNDIERLRNGIVITTVAQRDGKKAPPLTAKTKPSLVRQIDAYGIEMTLFEGRNRQIRKMMDALNYMVLDLHRVEFGGISLNPLKGAGSWKRLDDREMKLIEEILAAGSSDKSDSLSS